MRADGGVPGPATALAVGQRGVLGVRPWGEVEAGRRAAIHDRYDAQDLEAGEGGQCGQSP